MTGARKPTRTAQSSFPYRIRPTVHLIFLFSCPCGAHRFVSALPDSSPTTPCPASSDEPGGDDRSAAQSAAGTREKRRLRVPAPHLPHLGGRHGVRGSDCRLPRLHTPDADVDSGTEAFQFIGAFHLLLELGSRAMCSLKIASPLDALQ
ncbi:hypothetical protein PVAP13_8KG058944 [Panicum virgatum]|uniref:Uncharacterized protein n=1 Tax=Panicum virgatum TaxID=38727 RepID=A0A8T0PHG0_PANVG|nr:hypothetical protein PVAP13_8KG058944 [Panicum virgatum]